MPLKEIYHYLIDKQSWTHTHTHIQNQCAEYFVCVFNKVMPFYSGLLRYSRFVWPHVNGRRLSRESPTTTQFYRRNKQDVTWYFYIFIACMQLIKFQWTVKTTSCACRLYSRSMHFGPQNRHIPSMLGLHYGEILCAIVGHNQDSQIQWNPFLWEG